MSGDFDPRLLRALRAARRVGVLTGAGISAASGIPTFRDAQSGLWSRFRPEELATADAFRRDPQLVWDWYAWRRGLVAGAAPNAAHIALARLQTLVPVLTLVTQNVDGLHQRAGSVDVVELHGNIHRSKCFVEGIVVDAWPETVERPPRCPTCGAHLRPDVVWFGERLPPDAIARAEAAARECDLYFSIGTSAAVFPAAQLPMTALQGGATVIEVNKDPTPLTRAATFSLLGAAGTILPALLDAAWSAWRWHSPGSSANFARGGGMRDRYDELYRAFRWQVPERFNIAEACCRRHARDRHRFCLYWEDESGATSAWTYWDIQQQANRISNVLAGLGVRRGDRVAIILPQRPETVIVHVACYQMGAVAMPLSILFGPEALEYRLRNSETSVAFLDSAALPNLQPIRDRLPDLKHVVGVAGALEAGVTPWERLLEKASWRFAPADTAAEDPALLIYTSGTTGPPKGALKPQRVLIGNLPGFRYSHDEFPQTGDMFWSPADWAWTGGLMDALLPTLYYGYPILGYRGRFDPERAFRLLEKYQVRNSFLFPTALKMMMKAVPSPRARYDLALRSIMSAGEAVGETVFDWSREHLGVTINEMFGQTEINYLVGNSHTLWPAKPGSIGRPYPGHRIAVIDDAGADVAPGEIGEIAVNRNDIHGDRDAVFFLGYWKNEKATREKFSGDWCRTGDLAKRDADGYFWYQGRADDMFKAAGYRIGPSEIENCLVKHPAVANAAVVPSPDPERGNVVKAFIVLTPGHQASRALEDEIRNHVRGRLAPYEYPKEIEFIDALPMTTTGKVQRRVLRLREEERKREAGRAQGDG